MSSHEDDAVVVAVVAVAIAALALAAVVVDRWCE